MLEGQKFQGQSKIVFQQGREGHRSRLRLLPGWRECYRNRLCPFHKRTMGKRWAPEAGTFVYWRMELTQLIVPWCSFYLQPPLLEGGYRAGQVGFLKQIHHCLVGSLFLCYHPLMLCHTWKGAGEERHDQIQQENSLVVHEKADLWLLTCAERGRNPPCGYRERKWVNAGMGIALKQSLESQSSQGVLSMENPFALSEWFCSTAKEKHVVERLYFFLLGSYFDTLTERTMCLIGCYNQAQSEHILAQSNVIFRNLLGSKEKK